MIKVIINQRDYTISRQDTVNCTYAYAHPNSLTFGGDLSFNPVLAGAQIRNCKQLIVHGGDTPTLINRLSLIPNLTRALEDKTLVLFSAGVGAMTVASYNIDHRIFMGGLGIIKATSIVHYHPSYEPAVAWLTTRFPHLPVLLVGNDPIQLGVHTNGRYSKI